MTRKTLVELAEDGDLVRLQEQVESGVDVNTRMPDGRVALHAALAEARHAVVHYLLARGADPRLVDASGYTSLHWAARSDDAEIVQLAYDLTGKDVDVADVEGRTSLSWVAQGNDVLALEWLLAHGADPNHVDRDGWGPLHYAAADGHVDSIVRLLAAGARPLLRLPPNPGEEYGPSASDLARNFAPQSPVAAMILDQAETGGAAH